MCQVESYLRVRRAVMVHGMSIREAAREFGLHRDTGRKMLAYSVPPGCRRQTPPRRPKLEPFTGIIDRILEDDLGLPRKQRHTAQRIFERLKDEYGFPSQYTIVKDYVREHRRRTQEMFVPLSHPPGHTQCDFGETLVVIGGMEQKAHQTGQNQEPRIKVRSVHVTRCFPCPVRRQTCQEPTGQFVSNGRSYSEAHDVAS